LATSIKIDPNLKTRLDRLATARQRTPHWLMREAIAEFVDREEARESFRQDAQAAWASYQETGRHLTGGEVQNWIATWGTEDESPAPECHD
jgi:predicted transcriptional regulator